MADQNGTARLHLLEPSRHALVQEARHQRLVFRKTMCSAATSASAGSASASPRPSRPCAISPLLLCVPRYKAALD